MSGVKRELISSLTEIVVTPSIRKRLGYAKQMGLNMKETKNGNGANLGFEAKLWTAADKMRNNMDAAEYKHVVLGLIFLKYISDAFAEVYLELKNDPEKLSNPEDKDEYKAKMQHSLPIHYMAVSPLAHRKRLFNPKTENLNKSCISFKGLLKDRSSLAHCRSVGRGVRRFYILGTGSKRCFRLRRFLL